MDAKTGIVQGLCISKIQNGRHSDLRYTLLRIPKGLWPRDISPSVIVMANLATSCVILLKLLDLFTFIEQKKTILQKKLLKIIRFHTRPDVAGGKVSPGKGI